MEEKYINHIKSSLINAENLNSKINEYILNMEGASGIKTRHFYNNLCSMEDSRYLEIGTWKGSSVCSAMCNNNASIVCIDNFSQFGSPKSEFLINFNQFIGNNNALFIENDCYNVDISSLPKFNIYMFDGDHSYSSQFNALTHYYHAMDDIFIYIVDDWNWSDVRNGTNDAIKHLNLDILYKKEIRLTFDNSHTPSDIAQSSWWNGIFISVLKKK